KKISSERREFEAGTLDESNVPVAPMTLFNTWMKEALDKMAMEPYAFNLATASKDGIPSSRTVYMRSIEE
ncbi:MAG: pyridoxamine 5'-phosphate oxidase, partial [Flavobacteriales bacterium]